MCGARARPGRRAMTGNPSRVAVLISGRGSNMAALIDHSRTDDAGYEVVLVVSDRPQAAGLDLARAAGVATWAVDSRGVDRTSFDAMVSQQLESERVGTIALAGYMRLLSPEFVKRWHGRIVNIHPSLLPKYRGLCTHQRALAAGDTISGCTVHLVTEELDAGEVLAQAEVKIAPGDDPDALSRRVLAAEHALYSRALGEFIKRQPTISSGLKK